MDGDFWMQLTDVIAGIVLSYLVCMDPVLEVSIMDATLIKTLSELG